MRMSLCHKKLRRLLSGHDMAQAGLRHDTGLIPVFTFAKLFHGGHMVLLAIDGTSV